MKRFILTMKTKGMFWFGFITRKFNFWFGFVTNVFVVAL